MSVSWSANAYIRGGLYDANGVWIVGVGIESPSGYKSTIHSTAIPVYKNQYFSCNEITSTSHGSEYVCFIPNNN